MRKLSSEFDLGILNPVVILPGGNKREETSDFLPPKAGFCAL
jgi:hypothetical protein